VQNVPTYDRDRFTYAEVRTEKTVLILSTCKDCGACKLVSHFDLSLEDWERDHVCQSSGSWVSLIRLTHYRAAPKLDSSLDSKLSPACA